MTARREAYGWASIYGAALGIAARAAEDADFRGHPIWAGLFLGYAVALVPIFMALQWRELRS